MKMSTTHLLGGILAAVVTGCCSVGEKAAPVVSKPSPTLIHRTNVPFKLGMARYTFRGQSFDRVLAVMEKLDCHNLGLIEGTLAYNATADEIAAYKAKCAARGVEVISVGPLYCTTEEEVKNCFEFCKKYGLKYISAVPYDWNPAFASITETDPVKLFEARKRIEPNLAYWRFESDRMLDILDRYVKEYDIKVAIHNHGPDMPVLFPTAEAALKRIGNRDRRIGVCLDVGHNMRAGSDPLAFIRKHGERIYEVHLKNIKIDPALNLAKEGPRGELDIEGMMKGLAERGFDGYCLIEYEKGRIADDMELAETFGYFRGVMDTVKIKTAVR